METLLLLFLTPEPKYFPIFPEPVEIEEVKQEPQESEEDSEIKEMVRKIYILESSGGKHDSCHKIGKENGFGYGIYKGKHTCFDSHEEVTAKVEEWFRKKLKVYDLRSAVCIYNTGKTAPCPYYQKFKSLK
jgi:uncharacterized protein (DUF1697 family)